jgi:predicted phage tail protein
LNVWGSYFYKEANDVARLSVPVTTAADSLEALSMVLQRAIAVLNMGWDKVRVAVPFVNRTKSQNKRALCLTKHSSFNQTN